MSSNNYPYIESQYGYKDAYGLHIGGPTKWICIVFIVLFSLSTAAHFGQALYTKRWFLMATLVVGGFGEIVGWVGRYWGGRNPYNFQSFIMQICATIISPTFLSAANFIILGQIIRDTKGERFSRLSARNYAIVFLAVDTFALVAQAAGGGIASSQDAAQSRLGGHIMLAGIILQLVAIIVYVIIAGEFLYRLQYNKPLRGATTHGLSSMSSIENDTEPKVDSSAPTLTSGVRLMLLALVFSTLCLFIRSVYRTIELADGWNGRIIDTEVYFNVLDGMMIILALATLNFFHPGRLLRKIE